MYTALVYGSLVRGLPPFRAIICEPFTSLSGYEKMTTVPAQSRATSRRPAASSHVEIRPFLKWAGGKRQLLPQLARFQPPRFGAYCEPFLGSGALFCDLQNRGLLSGRRAVLMDNNSDLVGCWLAVRREAPRGIRSLRRLAAAHASDPNDTYYRVRDERFNPGRRKLSLTDGRWGERYTPGLAAMLIYLNRTGFNGLFRLNAAGGFNVPIGRYVNPRICDAGNLRRVSDVLSRPGVEIREDDFESVCEWAMPGDFVYFDPPYAPVSATASFTAYTSGGFPSASQCRLQQVVIELARRGCYVLLSNSITPVITALYVDNVVARAAGLRAYKVSARRSINSRGSARGLVGEYLISNIKRRD